MDKRDFGSYFIGLRLGYKEYPKFRVSCKTRVDVYYQPAFTGDQIGDQTITCGKSWLLKVPEYNDVFGAPAKVMIDLGTAALFLSYDETTRIITTRNPDTS